jgi:hypothetical protein
MTEPTLDVCEQAARAKVDQARRAERRKLM